MKLLATLAAAALWAMPAQAEPLWCRTVAPSHLKAWEHSFCYEEAMRDAAPPNPQPLQAPRPWPGYQGSTAGSSPMHCPPGTRMTAKDGCQ